MFKASLILFCTLLFAPFVNVFSQACAQDSWRIGTWKTAQTIQPFFYDQFNPDTQVDVFPFTNPADQKSALLAGSLDMCGTTLAHAIHASSRGEPVVVVAALCNKCSALVVAKDGNILTESDLKGTKIGYVPGTMHEILLREVLRAQGLNPDKDVRLVRVDFFDMKNALANGDIDAFLSGEPFPSLAVLEDIGRILSYPYFDNSIGTVNAAMLVRSDLIKNNPAKIRAMVNAHIKATKYLKNNQDKWLSKAAQFGFSRAVLDKACPNMELAWNMDNAFSSKVKVLGQKMLALGLIEREPDYNLLLNTDFVRAFQAEKQ